MAIVDVVKFDGPEDVFAWKYPKTELGTWTQLIVNESQEAILFKGGQALDLFGAGRHTLSTQNIPLLQSVINLPFGGRSPFAAEVWFINKIHSMDIKWGTATPLQLQDPKYQVILSVRAFGQFGIQVEDSRKFLIKLIGTQTYFDKEALVSYFRGLLMMNINEIISSYLVHKKISILEINAYAAEISKHVEERIRPTFQENGIRLLNFFVSSINTPEVDPSTIRLRDALAKKAEMDIIGYTYQQQRTFDTLEGAAKNEGGSGADLMGAGIGMGMGFGLGGSVGNQVAGMAQQLNIGAKTKTCPNCRTATAPEANFCIACGYSFQTAATEMKMCHECGKPIPDGAKFCPHCGDVNNACPSCGTDNPMGALTCIKCGQSMGVQVECPSCGMKVNAEAKFCPNCGKNLGKQCGKCGHPTKPGQKFCLECGNALTEQEDGHEEA